MEGKPKAESCEISYLHDPGSPGSKAPSDTVLSPVDTVLVAPLLWLSLLEICCRPLWVAHALRGPLVLP